MARRHCSLDIYARSLWSAFATEAKVDANAFPGMFHRLIYAEIARRLDAEPRSSWFIGDDPVSDVCGPAEFGFNTAWLERYLPWPEGRERCFKHRLSHVSELADALFHSTCLV